MREAKSLGGGTGAHHVLDLPATVSRYASQGTVRLDRHIRTAPLNLGGGGELVGHCEKPPHGSLFSSLQFAHARSLFCMCLFWRDRPVSLGEKREK